MSVGRNNLRFVEPSVGYPNGLAYAGPIIRSPSPASTVGSPTPRPPLQLCNDIESDENLEQLSDDTFEQWVYNRMRLNDPNDAEIKAMRNPLLNYEKLDNRERYMMYQDSLRYLRGVVKQLEEDRLFEELALRGCRITDEPLAEIPTTITEVEKIMGSLLKTDETLIAQNTVSDGPWKTTARDNSSVDTQRPSSECPSGNTVADEPIAKRKGRRAALKRKRVAS